MSAATIATVAAARTRLVLDHPWWSALALRLYPVLLADGHDLHLQTACTDGAHLWIRPAWWLALSPAERVGVLIHESLHCGLLHHLRRGSRDPRRWNIAADHAINLILLAAGVTLPSSALADPGYEGLSAEEIYALLPEDCGGGASCGEVSDGKSEAGEGEAGVWREATAAVLGDLARAGKLSGSAEEALTAALAPTIPWRELLAHHLTRAAGAEDTTWARLARRGLARGELRPATYANACGPLVICVDTSGSMDLETISTAIEEARACVDQCRPTQTVVIYADARVQRVDTIAPGEHYAVTSVPGRGGTDFAPALLASEQYDPVAIIYVTDGQGAYPKNYPDAEIIWLFTAAGVAAVGTTIYLPTIGASK